MGKNKIPDWIVIDTTKKEGDFLCKRCLEIRVPIIPCAIDDFVKQAEAFAETHKFCK
jgi:hypothetical protein